MILIYITIISFFLLFSLIYNRNNIISKPYFNLNPQKNKYTELNQHETLYKIINNIPLLSYLNESDKKTILQKNIIKISKKVKINKVGIILHGKVDFYHRQIKLSQKEGPYFSHSFLEILAILNGKKINFIEKITVSDIIFLEIDVNYIFDILSIDFIDYFISLSFIEPYINYFNFHQNLLFKKIHKTINTKKLLKNLKCLFFNKGGLKNHKTIMLDSNTKVNLSEEYFLILEYGTLEIKINRRRTLIDDRCIIGLFLCFFKTIDINIKSITKCRFLLVKNDIRKIELIKHFFKEKYYIIDACCEFIRLEPGDKLEVNKHVKTIYYVLGGKLENKNQSFVKDSIIGEREYIKGCLLSLKIRAVKLSYILNIPVKLRNFIFKDYNISSETHIKKVFIEKIQKYQIITFYFPDQKISSIIRNLKMVFYNAFFLEYGENLDFIEYKYFSCGELKFYNYLMMKGLNHSFIFIILDKRQSESLRLILNVSDVFLIAGHENIDQFPIFYGKIERVLFYDDKILKNAGFSDKIIKPPNKIISLRKITPEKTYFYVNNENLEDTKHVSSTKVNLSRNCINDLKRLKRSLQGKKIGLVLGGGAARAFAHIGVLRALEDEGIPIDYIGGTSMGAFIGGIYAMECSNIHVYKIAKTFSHTISNYWNAILDLTIPICSFFTGEGLNREVIKVFKDKRIEDLWLDYYCISTNITYMDQQIHRSGSLWKYVRASMSIVEYLPPINDNGNLLIDGAYSNNVPVDIMMNSPVNTIIAVDVGTEVVNNFPDYKYSLSGIKIMLNRIFCRKKYLTYNEIQNRLAFLSNHQKLKKIKNYNKVYMIKLQMNYNSTDFNKFLEIVCQGYNDAKVVLKKWKNDKQKCKIFNQSAKNKRRNSI